jgi:hypothetical protein
VAVVKSGRELMQRGRFGPQRYFPGVQITSTETPLRRAWRELAGCVGTGSRLA